jgi:hypothetical protein
LKTILADAALINTEKICEYLRLIIVNLREITSKSLEKETFNIDLPVWRSPVEPRLA